MTDPENTPRQISPALARHFAEMDCPAFRAPQGAPAPRRYDLFGWLCQIALWAIMLAALTTIAVLTIGAAKIMIEALT